MVMYCYLNYSRLITKTFIYMLKEIFRLSRLWSILCKGWLCPYDLLSVGTWNSE